VSTFARITTGSSRSSASSGSQRSRAILPVQDGEKLLGVISFHDVAKALLRETNMENRLLKRYIKDLPESEAPAK
jgi:CBS domain-containing protein